MPQPPKYSLPDVDPNELNIGKNIANLRKHKGFNQKELAGMIGLTQALLSHYETGRLSIPVEVVMQIAVSLNITTDEILGLKKSAIVSNDGPNRRILQRLKQIESLPAFDQKSLLKTIDNALKGAGISTPTDKS